MSDSPDLKPLLTRWQDRLSLRDWEIEARYARRCEFGSDAWGTLKACVPKKYALIRLLHPEDRQFDLASGGALFHESVEESLVHELLHIHLWDWAGLDDGGATTAEEQAVNAIAKALVDRD